MGSFSTWHWLIVLLLLCVPLAILWLLVRALRTRGGPDARSGTAERLRQLEALRASGAVDEDEYREKRREILQQM